MKLLKLTLCLAICVFAFAASGCDDETKENKEPEKKIEETKEKPKPSVQKEQPKKEEAKEITLKYYFPDEEGTKLIAVTKKMKVLEKDKYKSAMTELLKGTDKKGTITIIPKKTKLKSIKVKDGVATVDFSGDIVKYFVGGSTGEELMIASIVNTLTEFNEIKSVQILVDGKEVETIAGHMDLTAPLTRMNNY